MIPVTISLFAQVRVGRLGWEQAKDVVYESLPDDRTFFRCIALAQITDRTPCSLDELAMAGVS